MFSFIIIIPPPSMSCKLPATADSSLAELSISCFDTPLPSMPVTCRHTQAYSETSKHTRRSQGPFFQCCITVLACQCLYVFRQYVVFNHLFPPLLLLLPFSVLHHLLLYLLLVSFGWVVNIVIFFFFCLITSCVLCIAPPAPPPSGPPSTLTPGGSSTLSKKRPPPPPPGHKRTLSDPPSPLSHSPHSKGGLTGGEMQLHRTAGLLSLKQPHARETWFSIKMFLD